MLAGECGIRAGHRVRHRRAIAAASPPRSTSTRVDEGIDAARTAAPVAQRPDRRARRGRGARRCRRARRRTHRSLARRRVSRRRHRRSAAQRGVLPDAGSPRGLRRTRRSDVWNHFPSTPVDVIAERVRLRRAARAAWSRPARRARLRSAAPSRRFGAGRADAVLAGGTDALARLTFSGFNLLRLMDPAPCRPFDRSRAGMNIGEGAGILVLEDLDRARAPRRAASTPSSPATASPARRSIRRRPSRRASRWRRSSRSRCSDAGINADEVEHINAHGTATPQNDAAEARGFRRVFGDRAGRIPVTSIKSMIGHCLGAAGAVEAAALALTIARGAIPPTIHHSETDDDCRRRRRRQRGARAARALRGVDVARLRRQRLGDRDARGVVWQVDVCRTRRYGPRSGRSGATSSSARRLPAARRTAAARGCRSAAIACQVRANASSSAKLSSSRCPQRSRRPSTRRRGSACRRRRNSTSTTFGDAAA